jgi:hypothetical protein
MAEVIVDRVRRYILDGSDMDLRLLGVSQISGGMARSAFRRIGNLEGWKAGCVIHLPRLICHPRPDNRNEGQHGPTRTDAVSRRCPGRCPGRAVRGCPK